MLTFRVSNQDKGSKMSFKTIKEGAITPQDITSEVS